MLQRAGRTVVRRQVVNGVVGQGPVLEIEQGRPGLSDEVLAGAGRQQCRRGGQHCQQDDGDGGQQPLEQVQPVAAQGQRTARFLPCGQRTRSAGRRRSAGRHPRPRTPCQATRGREPPAPRPGHAGPGPRAGNGVRRPAAAGACGEPKRQRAARVLTLAGVLSKRQIPQEFTGRTPAPALNPAVPRQLAGEGQRPRPARRNPRRTGPLGSAWI